VTVLGMFGRGRSKVNLKRYDGSKMRANVLKIETATAVNHLTSELNPSAQHCLTRFFTGDFAS
jgi:hypothetical protein